MSFLYKRNGNHLINFVGKYLGKKKKKLPNMLKDEDGKSRNYQEDRLSQH